MKILIIEDEAAAARRLAKMVTELAPEADILAQLDSVSAGLTWFAQNGEPDLLFLDIHLADGSSFELFDHIAPTCPIIFTTAYDQYAVQAFKVNAIDYLLKPIKRAELEAALNKYRRWDSHRKIDYQQLARGLRQDRHGKRFLIRIGQQIRLVGIGDIAYAYTESKITFVVTREGKRYPVDYSLEKMEELLPAEDFFRINRQFIVHIEAIREMYAYSKSRVKLALDPACDLETVVSTERSPLFKKWLQGE